MQILHQDESIRRKPIEADEVPSLNHQLAFNIAKPYLKNKVVLDIGCWTGQYTVLAKDHVRRIVGIDPGFDAIQNARSLYSKYKNMHFQVGRAEKLPFPNKTFDVVVMNEVIEHVEKHKEYKVIQEIDRVLKPGGVLIMSTPNKNIFSILLDPAFYLIGHRHYSYDELSTFFISTSLTPIKTRYIGGFYHLFTTNIELILKHIFKYKLNRPLWLQNKIRKEYEEGGFSNIIVIASKKG